MSKDTGKSGLHPRNRFRSRYDFPALVQSCPHLADFVTPNALGDLSIDYANPDAVKALNQALLMHAYGLHFWDIPRGSLCPPVPGRSDYLHCLADLLAGSEGAPIPRGKSIAVLDIGTGANCIYSLIGASEYGWRFVGSEIDRASVSWAKKLVTRNRGLSELIEVRPQRDPLECFRGVVLPGEQFDACMCNPPFHTSAAEASAGTRKKLSNLNSASTVLNFGGKSNELWCEGGELAFIRRMITQSTAVATQCLWFTTLVSKGAHLQPLYKELRAAKTADVRTIEMTQGQKVSRILAWTFVPADQQQAWRNQRQSDAVR